MKRPAGIVITSVVEVLGSLFTLMVAVVMAFLPRFAPNTPAQPQLPAGFYFAIGVIYLIFALLGLATAVGVFLCKQWARYSTLVFAGILAGFGVLLAVTFAFMPLPSSPEESAAPLPPHFALILKTSMVLIQLAIAGLGAWWLYYFNRSEIKLHFAGAVYGGAEAASPRPLSIALLSILNFIGVPWMLSGAWLALPIPFFGIYAHGVSARIEYLVFAAIALYIGIGLWQLVPASRLVAIWYYVIGCLNTTLFYSLPGREERYRKMFTDSLNVWHLPLPHQPPMRFMVGAWTGITISFIVAAVAVYFLVTRRYAFQEQAAMALPPEPPVLPGS
jgi:hypothetical protein